MATLTSRVQALEVAKEYDATKAAVQKVEAEFLEKLREIRASMADGSGGATSKEVEALQAENGALKKKNSKLEYRIQHMLTTMEELYQKPT